MSIFSHSFAGKRVLVTGAGKAHSKSLPGVGEVIVRRFYEDGATVFVLDKNQSSLDGLKKDLPHIETICVDLDNWNETYEAVLKIAPLDHLVNNGAILFTEQIMDITKQHVDHILNVNTGSVVCATKAFVNGNMKEGKESGKTIVNIGSISEEFAVWGRSVYGSSKAALRSLTKSMAVECGDLNIRVNNITLGLVQKTGMGMDFSVGFAGKAKGLFNRPILKERLLESSDVANVVMFFSSPLSSKITGTYLHLDAGACAALN